MRHSWLSARINLPFGEVLCPEDDNCLKNRNRLLLLSGVNPNLSGAPAVAGVK